MKYFGFIILTRSVPQTSLVENNDYRRKRTDGKENIITVSKAKVIEATSFFRVTVTLGLFSPSNCVKSIDETL